MNPLDLHCSANSTSSADHTLPAEQNIAEHPRAISIIKMKNKERQRPKKTLYSVIFSVVLCFCTFSLQLRLIRVTQHCSINAPPLNPS